MVRIYKCDLCEKKCHKIYRVHTEMIMDESNCVALTSEICVKCKDEIDQEKQKNREKA